ncbi:PEGA domain-containing protein [bacterium]|nr:PEGA domain-containing protein [bacterium]MBU1635437.1 PEGA domain-containing protein [bacterium]
MTKFRISLVLSFIIAFTIPQVYVKAQVPIAVIDLEGKGILTTEASTLSDRLRDELFKTGKFQVMERGLMDQILKEQKFQLSGCTSNECLVEIGQLISVRQIIGGSIGKVGNVYSISARIIDVETGKIKSVSTYDYIGDIGGLLTQGMKNVAVQLTTGKTSINEQSLHRLSGSGSLYISSAPSDAEVWIDDKKINGKTPLLVENQFAGKHKITVQKKDYSAETTVQLEANDIQKVILELKLGLGNIKVITTPFEANVYLDGEYKGKSPLFLKNIDSGLHRLKVIKSLFEPVEKSIKIISNKDEEVLITLSEFIVTFGEEVTDIDGNVYKTVKIGDQWWMAENLKVTHYRNGDAIPNVTGDTEWSNLTTGAYCNYNNDDNNATNADTYGRLYNWYAVNDSRNIAPTGWHVPSDEEWKELEMYLGMSQSDADATGVRGTDEGGKLKETGTNHWSSPNTDATNESGFAALPGGYRGFYGSVYYMGNYAYFWSSTESEGGSAWGRRLNYSNSDVYRYYFSKQYGFSVRCVRD